jgi:hypothetical protein
MAEYGLELHAEKTRLIEFGRFAAANRQGSGAGKPETFDYLGFTHICGTIWKSGKFTVKRKTVGKRMTGKLKAVKAAQARRMHQPIEQTGKWLTRVVAGYYNYHAVPGNLRRLYMFRRETARHGCSRCGGAVSAADGHGSASRLSSNDICRNHEFCTLIRWSGLAPNIRDRSRVR